MKNSLLLLINIILIMTEIMADSYHSELGNYPGITSETCGLAVTQTIIPHNFSTKCLSYRKPIKSLRIEKRKLNFDKTGTRIMGGHDTDEHEVPWAAFLVIGSGVESCSGVIITNKWILTSAHCLISDQIKVFIGNNDLEKSLEYESNQTFKNPHYIEGNLSCEHDLALIKLNEEIDFFLTENQYMSNSICLPKINKLNTERENAVTYGWGSKSNITDQIPSKLQKGVFLLEPFDECRGCYCSLANSSGSPITCLGDSGSGLVQFVGKYNRSVIIGIFQGGIPDDYDTSDLCDSFLSRWTPISLHINWIIDTINRYN